MKMKVSRTTEKPGLFDDNFISHLSSSQNLSKLEANRLEMQWKKICDHEKRSKERNRELLKDFERVEKHAAMLAVKSQRLKSYKQQYENYINKMYPRWREELENYRMSQQQSRNGPTRSTSGHGAPLLPPSSSSRTATAPRHSGNSHFSSTPAHPSRSLPYDSAVMYTPGSLHNSHFQDPYSEFSYRERHVDSSHMHSGSAPQSRHPQQADSRWQSPSFYDSHRQFDNRAHQSQFVSSHREPDNVYQRSPDHYLASSFYDGRPPTGEVPGNFSSDARYRHPNFPHGQSQGLRPAAPYEPRTELQRSYLGHGGHQGPHDQGGHGGHYYDGWQGGHYGDQRPTGFEPRRMERDISGRDEPLVDKKFVSGLPTRPGMANGQDTLQDANYRPPTNQPFVLPEKPLERNIPMSSFPEPSLSSTVMETSAESNDVHRNEIQDGVSVTPTTTSHSAGKDKEEGKLKKEYVLKDQGLSKERTEVSVKTRELEVEPDVSAGARAPPTTKSAGISEDGRKNISDVESVDDNAKELNGEGSVQHILQESDKLEDAELSDEDESLDLSDLSLPDGNEGYVPSALQNEQRRDSKHAEDKRVHEDSDVSAGHSKPDVVHITDATKSITEEISEDIPESAGLEDSEDHKDLPVYNEGETTLPSNKENVLKQRTALDVRNDVDEMEKDTNDILHRNESEKDASKLLSKNKEEFTVQKTKEEKKTSLSVDGFLALLQAVDADVEVSFSPEALYRSPQCSSDMREEIIRAAEVGSSLQCFDPNTISTIVLEELPLLISSSSAGCLIPDRVFSKVVSCRSEKELRPFVETSLIKLWKSLFSHFVNVVTNKVMRAEEVGSMFGSLLISQYSRHGKESQLLLCRILETAISNVSDRSGSPAHDLDLEPRFETEAPYNDDVSIASEGSSSTLGSTPPKVQPVKPSEEDRKPTPEPSASYDNDFEDDVPLTESAAYLKMMSSARSEPDDDISDLLRNSGPQKRESEADEDVERELARSISPPVTSPRAKSPSHMKGGKQKPKLSLFDTGATTAGEKADNKDLGDSWGGSSMKSKSDISDSESVVSPPLSPDDGFGYIPTALESKDQQQSALKEDKDNEKSEPKSANDSKAKRKTDFWNNSDTESEVDLQLSTGGFDQDDDDFDFYG